jgi:eukaryotic-like serine/threonine-protein kinase
MTGREGQRLDHYYLRRLLGKGAFGEVYLAEHVHRHTWVALKVLTFDLDQDMLKTFLREARTLFLLKHPSIVPLLDFGLENETPFLVMEYAPNGTLRQRHRSGERVRLDIVASYVQQMASALQFAHDQRLIHRDVKPQNMLIGNHKQVLLSDFGLATIARSEHSPSVGDLIGTVPYMAPEQIQGKAHIGTDQYALGICAYEWLCGVRPFLGSTVEVITQHLSAIPARLRSHAPEIPAEVEEVVLRTLAKEPRQRFPSVAEFATTLEQICQSMGFSPLVLILDEGQESSSANMPVISSSAKPDSEVPLLSPFTLSDQEERETELPYTSAAIISPVSPSEPVVPKAPEESAATRSLASIEDFTFEVPSSPPPLTPIPAHPRARGHAKRWRRLFILLVLVFLVSGGILIPAIWIKNNQRIAALKATAEARAKIATRLYQDWTDKHGIMFGFDAAHTNWNPLEQAISTQNVADLSLLWSYTTGNVIKSSVTVANGMAYIGSDDGYLYAFDAKCRANCQPLWSYSTSSFMRSSPAIANGILYIGADNGKFYAFDTNCRESCLELWSYTVGGGIESSPVVADGKVYVGSWDDKLYAFDANCRENCQPLWSYKTGSGVFSSPSVANGLVYVGSVDGKFYAFDKHCLQSCQPLWSYATGYGISSSPAIANGIVYIGSGDHKFYAFDAGCRQNCQPLWLYPTNGRVSSSPSIANGKVYIGSDDGKFYAFDASCRASCQPLWSYATADKIFSSPMVANGVVYVGADDQHLYAFDAACRKGCQPLWSYTMNDAVLSSPTVANGVVYIGSADHKVYAFGL